MKIDQLLASAHEGDATGDAALSLAGALRRAGHDAEVYALEVDPPLRRYVHSFADFPEPAAGDTTLLHFNIPSPLGETLARLPGRRGIVYHNLTPKELLLPWCPKLARLTALGRSQLAALATPGHIDLAIGVSRYNTRELERAGFPATATAPLFVDLERFENPAAPVLQDELARAASPLFLTVGRVAPNKRIEDFLKLAAYYLRWISPRARFAVVGGTWGLEGYVDRLHDLRTELGLDSRCAFIGRVSHDELVAWYRGARVYVCTSEHEGFCAPLLEAMKLDVPVVARKAAAIPETLDGAGILVDGGDPAAWAEVVHLVASDEPLRRRLVRRGRQRVRDFAPEKMAARWLEVLE